MNQNDGCKRPELDNHPTIKREDVLVPGLISGGWAPKNRVQNGKFTGFKSHLLHKKMPLYRESLFWTNTFVGFWLSIIINP